MTYCYKPPSDKTTLMGILNATPDSFSDGGNYTGQEALLSRCEDLIRQGADIIDIGAESTRPGAPGISVSEEVRRLSSVIPEFKKRFNAVLSVDTSKPEVAKWAIDHGADIINDVKGVNNPLMWPVMRKSNVAYIAMHSIGTPETMQKNPQYKDVVTEVIHAFSSFLEQSELENVILDPGIGFGKTVKHNVSLLHSFERFQQFNRPLLVGTSRKSFIGAITGERDSIRLEGTIVSSIMAVLKGAHIIRVHDVIALKKAVDVCDAIRKIHV